jgi:FHA domain
MLAPCSCRHARAAFFLLERERLNVPYAVWPSESLAIGSGFLVAAAFLDGIQGLVGQGLVLLEMGYERAPVLMLVLSALFVLPLVAVISFLAQRVARSKARRAALRVAQRRATAEADWTRERLSGTTIAAWPSQAWLTIEGSPNGTVRLAGQTFRIGRHEDNDIRLTDSSVHRYHAVIERTPEEAFVITDVSGKEGNGVRVNGERTAKARLADGDVIELGRAKLKFEDAPV